ncbi:TPR end-of-group domain-containing protein [Cupriavidus gilardii]|uniref:TPR end-of-group domain-containing protein n=1 Tax=Cupriavidus gilardii TaxID=82541 RepID=UPI0021BFE63E|nr:hypothetical protein [Cupriavidus gilardii]MCT9125894.1 hypothetical protein [Cupriavidus gilardii]
MTKETENENGTDSAEEQRNKEACAEARQPRPGTSPSAQFPWWAVAIGRIGRYTFGYVLPVYFIIGAIIVIALPSGTIVKLWPFEQSASGVPTSAPVSTLPTASKNRPHNGEMDPSPRSAPQAVDLSRPEARVAELARMAMDATKERVEMMKESYDKIFSIIAALAALLAFLGFKGVETFTATRARAEEATAQAEAAAASAKAAKEDLRQAVESFNDFRKNQYLIDNNAEINAAHGIVLREIADLYRKVTKLDELTGEEAEKAREEYCAYLHSSLYYLGQAASKPTGVAPRILTRVYGTMGNVQCRLENYHAAFQAAENAISVNPHDYSAHFNAACYKSLLAHEESQKSRPNHAVVAQYEKEMLSYLKRAIELNPEYKDKAKDEPDFDHVRRNSQFLALLS